MVFLISSKFSVMLFWLFMDLQWPGSILSPRLRFIIMAFIIIFSFVRDDS